MTTLEALAELVAALKAAKCVKCIPLKDACCHVHAPRVENALRSAEKTLQKARTLS